MAILCEKNPIRQWIIACNKDFRPKGRGGSSWNRPPAPFCLGVYTCGGGGRVPMGLDTLMYIFRSNMYIYIYLYIYIYICDAIVVCIYIYIYRVSVLNVLFGVSSPMSPWRTPWRTRRTMTRSRIPMSQRRRKRWSSPQRNPRRHVRRRDRHARMRQQRENLQQRHARGLLLQAARRSRPRRSVGRGARTPGDLALWCRRRYVRSAERGHRGVALPRHDPCGPCRQLP